MEQIGLVQSVGPDGLTEVRLLPEENCAGNCALCGGCQEQPPVLAQNSVNARVGDRVTLSVDPKVARKTAALLYTIVPVALLAGYLLGEQLWGRGGLVGLACGAAGLYLVLHLDRKMTQKHPTTYVITGLVSE